MSEGADGTGDEAHSGGEGVEDVERAGLGTLGEGLDEVDDAISDPEGVSAISVENLLGGAEEQGEETLDGRDGGGVGSNRLVQAEAADETQRVDGEIDLRSTGFRSLGDEQPHGTQAGEHRHGVNRAGDGLELVEGEDLLRDGARIPLEEHSLRVGRDSTSEGPGFNAEASGQVSALEGNGERVSNGGQVNTTKTSLDEVLRSGGIGVTVPLDFTDGPDTRVD